MINGVPSPTSGFCSRLSFASREKCYWTWSSCLLARILGTLGNMLGNSKMDMDKLNRCVKHYQFLSPRFSISCFSNYSQKTQCSFPSQPLSHYKDCDSRFSTKVFSPFWRMLSARRASCEGESTAPSATERMEQAEESLKQKGVAHASICLLYTSDAADES